MRGLPIAASLALVLSAAPLFAQQPPAQPRPAAPAAPRPAPAPAQTPPPAPAEPQAPFPAGAKYAFVDLQRIAAESNEGKISSAKIQTLAQKKQNDGAEKARQLQANQTKLQTSGGVMNDAARTQLEKEIERQTVEAQRFQQDAQAELNELQNELQGEFQKKLFPLLQQVAVERNLHMLFSRADAGIIWNDPGLDLTVEVIKKLDVATAKPATAPK